MNKILNKIKNHFIPNKENEHIPHILKHRSLNLVMLLVIVLELAFLVQYFVVFNKTNFLALVLPDALVTQTNEKRLENSTNTLTVNPLLQKAAELKALDMANKGYFAHNTPDGKTPWYFLDQVDYKYKYAGENLAVNFTESRDVTEAWMNSPGHRANIVKKEYTEIGIATSEGFYEGHKATFVVQFFGTPTQTKTEIQKVALNTNSNISNTNNVLGEEVKTTPKTQTIKPTTKEIKKVAVNKTETKTTPSIKETLPVEKTNQEVKLVEKNPEVAAISSLAKKISKVNVLSFIKDFATNPNNTISTLLFGILGIFLVIFMIYLIKTEIMHPFVIVKSSALIFVVFMLLFMNIKVWHYDTKVPENASSFTAIAL